MEGKSSVQIVFTMADENQAESAGNKAPPPKEPRKQGKPTAADIDLSSKHFNDYTSDAFISTLFQRNNKAKGGLSITMSSALSMYTSPGLVNLSSIHIKRLGVRGGAHMPAFFLFCFNSFAAHTSSTLRSTLAEQLVTLYDETFKESEEDRQSFRELYEYRKDNASQIHIAMVICKSCGSGPPAPSDCIVIAGISCTCDRTVGTVLKWIAVDTQKLLTVDLVNSKKADQLPLTGRGIGTLLLVVLQAILEMCDYETQIFAEVNVGRETPGKWYREKLYFAPCVVPTEHLPKFVKLHSLNDPELVLYHSTIKIRDIFIRELFQDTISLSTILVNARSILSSFGMPKPRDGGGALKNIPSDLYSAINNCISECETGVSFKDAIDGSPSETMKQIYGNDRELKGVWAKYASKSPSLKLPYIKTVDLLMGDCRGVQEEKSCLYLCISDAVFGSPQFYWRLRMICASAFYAFSYMPQTHPLYDPEKYMFTHITDELLENAAEETKDDEEETKVEVVTDKFEKKRQAFRSMSKTIISGSTDAGVSES